MGSYFCAVWAWERSPIHWLLWWFWFPWGILPGVLFTWGFHRPLGYWRRILWKWCLNLGKPKSNFSSRQGDKVYYLPLGEVLCFGAGKFLKLVRISPWRWVSFCLEIKWIINRERGFGCGMDSDTQMPSNPASEENLAWVPYWRTDTMRSPSWE